MAEFCKKCFIKKLMSKRERAAYECNELSIIESDDEELCESCGTLGPIVVGTVATKTQCEDFVKSLINLKDIIESQNRPYLGTDIDRFLFSMLVMFDGDSGINNCRHVDLGFNENYCLHEMYCRMMKERH